MLTKHLTGDAAADAISALVRTGVITEAEAGRLLSGEAMLLAIGDLDGGAVFAAAGRAAKGRGRPSLDDSARVDRARHLVEAEGMPLREAATAVGIARSTLSSKLNLGGSPGRPPKLSPDDVAEAHRALDSDTATMQVVAASLGVSEQTLRRALKRDAASS